MSSNLNSIEMSELKVTKILAYPPLSMLIMGKAVKSNEISISIGKIHLILNFNMYIK